MKLRLFGIPAVILGVALAIAFFKAYGALTRPSVPMPVAITVSEFAPGVQIGATVAEVRHGVAGMTYVPHLGFVGVPNRKESNLPDGRSVDFSQVRLLIDEQSRRQPNPNPAKTRVEAVEIVSAEYGASGDITSTLTRVFRRNPRTGCVRTGDATRFRDVSVWITPNERGGVAVIADHLGMQRTARPFMITSVLAFTGKFAGGRTLRADYADASCDQLIRAS
jgi:hypothetical protein